jgi:cardiolipin synthase
MPTTLPNLLTLSRIACIPLLVALMFLREPWAMWTACAVFVAAALTDYLDGWLARQRSEVSVFGKLLDPIADKMLVAATLFALLAVDHLGGISIIPALVILMREILIAGVREYLAALKARSLPVTALAKWKTAVQMVALGTLIIGDAGPAFIPVTAIGLALIWVAALLTVVTGWEYVREAMKIIFDEPPPAARRTTAAGTYG